MATDSAALALEPSAEAARAPASAADLAANDSAPQTASWTEPSTSRSATGHANANSRMAAPHFHLLFVNAGSSGALTPPETSGLRGMAEGPRPQPAGARG